MRKLRKVISTILALVLFLNTIPPARAAEEDPGRLLLTASEAAVDHGGTVAVSVSASQSFVTRAAGLTVAYDPEILEPELENCQTAEPFRVSGPMTVQGKTVLRISFFPGEEGYSFSADQSLAVLSFRTVGATESTAVEMTAAYIYDAEGNQITLQNAEPVQIRVAPIPVTGVTLDTDALELEIGETRTLQATVLPENASDKSVSWSSSDEAVVSVENGVLTGHKEGTATVTASANGFRAECAVTVVYPAGAGYVLEMPEDKTAVVGDTVTVSPVIRNAEGVAVYNAYDITVAYDASMLLLTSEQLEDISVTEGEGSVQLIHYGPDREIDTVPFDLTFQALQNGETQVEVTVAWIDHSENALMKNAPMAVLTPGTTQITVAGYTVSLPDDFLGESVVAPGEDYTFEAKDKLYDYTFEGSTMGDQSVTVTDNGDGTFTVENVTGPLVIQSEKTGKTFHVILGTDMTGNATAQYMTDYTATLREESGYSYTLDITVGGEYYNGYTKSENAYTIPGQDITGDIVFTVTKTEIGTAPPSDTYYDVTFEGSGAGAAAGYTASVAAGSDYTFTLNKEAGYRYGVTYTMGGGEQQTVRPDEAGIYTIPDVTGDLVITVTKELDEQDYSLEVYSYITLKDGKTMYLVLLSGGVDDSKVFAYGDSPMYYSEAYGAWCALTVEDGKLTAGFARNQISVKTALMDTISGETFDVNMTGLVDINDAQLVYDMYNGKYEDFTVINMHRFLNADVNADRKVTVNDAAGVVSNIK